MAIVGDPDDPPAALVDLLQHAFNGPALAFPFQSFKPASPEDNEEGFVGPSMAWRGLHKADYTSSAKVKIL